MAKYYKAGGVIYYFYIVINNLKIYFFLSEDEYTKEPMGCEIYDNDGPISELFSLDTFLIPLEDIKNKINNIMGFI